MSLINCLSVLDYIQLHHQDITSLEEAKSYIDMLARNGLMYHFDDGPENVLWALPPDWQPSEGDVHAMRVRQDQVYQLKGWSALGGCPIGYALISLRKYSGLDSVTKTTKTAETTNRIAPQ